MLVGGVLVEVAARPVMRVTSNTLAAIVSCIRTFRTSITRRERNKAPCDIPVDRGG